MELINSKGNRTLIYAKTIEDACIEQLKALIENPAYMDEKIRIMPDTHAGKGSVIGFTSTYSDKIIPNTVGVDISCLDKDTEVMTPSGWVKISEYKDGEILQYNKQTHEAYFKKPYAYIKAECDHFNWFKNAKGLDQMFSDEHTMLVHKGVCNKRKLDDIMVNPDFFKKIDNSTLIKGYYQSYTSFNIQQDGIDIPDEMIRVDIMVQADGCVRKCRDDYNRIELHLKKERKIERAEMLLNAAGIKYKKYNGSNDTVYIGFFAPVYVDKTLDKYYRANRRQLEIVCDECMKWDGHEGYRSYYSSMDRRCADVIQFAFASCDIRASIYVTPNGCSDVIPTKNKFIGYTCQPIEVKSEDGYKYCFTTETGFFVARRGGNIFVTGNCGMLCVKLGNVDIDLQAFDNLVRLKIPSGMCIHDNKVVPFKELEDLKCFRSLNDMKRIHRSIGTLGGGNHFIELDKNENGDIYLVIHTGSRNLGKQVCEYYQKIAVDLCHGKEEWYNEKERIIREYKRQGRKNEIQDALRCLKYKYEECSISDEQCYLYGRFMDDYLNDVDICARFAHLNRLTIADIIISKYFKGKSLKDFEWFETLHNYVDTKHRLIRKGSISAMNGEKVIIPMNMRDGSLVCIGKGNDDWNNSAPHGAGRLMSRAKAFDTLSLEDFKTSMNGIYTTSVNNDTIDEAPMVYKPMDEIMELIKDTVDVVEIIKPIYNFKASGELPWRKNKDK